MKFVALALCSLALGSSAFAADVTKVSYKVTKTTCTSMPVNNECPSLDTVTFERLPKGVIQFETVKGNYTESQWLVNESKKTSQSAVKADKDLKRINFFQSGELMGMDTEFPIQTITTQGQFFQLSKTSAVLLQTLTLVTNSGAEASTSVMYTLEKIN